MNSGDRDPSAAEELGRSTSAQAMSKERRGPVEGEKENDERSVPQIPFHTLLHVIYSFRP